MTAYASLLGIGSPVTATAAPMRQPTPGEIAAVFALPVHLARALFDAPDLGWTVRADGAAAPHVLVPSPDLIAHGVRWLPAGIEHVCDLAADGVSVSRRSVLRAVYDTVAITNCTHREAALRTLAVYGDRA